MILDVRQRATNSSGVLPMLSPFSIWAAKGMISARVALQHCPSLCIGSLESRGERSGSAKDVGETGWLIQTGAWRLCRERLALNEAFRMLGVCLLQDEPPRPNHSAVRP